MMRKGSKKLKLTTLGFTLIELLAVIVILGLLLAIAIPSITKYIIQARKKTLVSSVGNYISSVITDVNNQDYNFIEPNTVYAVPIECVPIEKGGVNPLGEWLQSNDDYWAYVLVQTNGESYNYGFTFKDSNGYGMYPTVQSEINPKSRKQIQIGLELTKPKSGSYTNITQKENWTGFNINDDTKVKVLEAEGEGVEGDGQSTCTLWQKGSNYEEVVVKKEQAIKDSTLMSTTKSSTTAFWGYRDKIKTITFQDSINIPSDITDEYKWDVSSTSNGKVMAYIALNSSNPSYYNLYIQGDGRIYANPDSSYLFYNFKNVDSINNIEILNIRNVTNMKSMFAFTGYSSSVFTLDLGDNFDTSNVINMSYMFQFAGYSNPNFTLDLGDEFDTSKVTNMKSMFDALGYSSKVFTLDLGDKFNTSNVTTMTTMFYETGRSSLDFTLNLGNNFDTSNVADMYAMFYQTGYSSTVFTLDLREKFDTSKVINMNGMFYQLGYSSPIFTLNLGNKFDTGNVADMYGMFYQVGYSSSDFKLDLGDKFNTGNVTNMSWMFAYTGYSSKSFKLDCSSWNVDKVIKHDYFNYGSARVTSPTWKN